ncbi:ser/Thr phosphatase family protein [Firmicutes bacterium CAG:240]|nr:ser/Thr phosphatase family protein [Firmicutes bacterium CAG:240]
MKTKGKKHRGRGCLTALIILALIAAAAAFLIKDSRDDLEISRYEVKSQKLPESFDGFKIVQLSDLHGAEFGEDGMELVEKVKELEPDMIALTGDFVTDEGDLAAVEKLAARLTELCPVYFISGNHEFGSGLAVKVRNILERAGVKYLSNEYLTISRGEDGILLGGVEDPLAYADMLSPDELAQKMNDAAPDAFKILLGHRNYWMTEYPELPVDLIFCGHAHGGLIRIPGVGGLIGTDRRLFPDFDAGEYNNGRYTLIVSRGLGNSVPIPRVFNRPEIVCVELSSAYARA